MDVPDRARWRSLALLAVAMTFSMSTWSSASAVLPALRERWSLSSVEGSLLTIAVQIGFVIGALVSAITRGRRPERCRDDAPSRP